MSTKSVDLTVTMLPDSTIGEFDCGPFSGHAERVEAKRKPGEYGEKDSTIPAYWSVTLGGIDGAWREVMLPLKKGRTLQKAIVTACEQFNGPEDIMPDRHGYFGGRLDLR